MEFKYTRFQPQKSPEAFFSQTKVTVEIIYFFCLTAQFRFKTSDPFVELFLKINV